MGRKVVFTGGGGAWENGISVGRKEWVRYISVHG